jgi:hypothetical protein
MSLLKNNINIRSTVLNIVPLGNSETSDVSELTAYFFWCFASHLPFDPEDGGDMFLRHMFHIDVLVPESLLKELRRTVACTVETGWLNNLRIDQS